MKALGRVWWMSLGAVLSFVFILFAIHNHERVLVDLAMRRFQVEVWALVMIGIAIGMVVPAAVVLGQRIASARRERALRRRVRELEGELRALRNVAVVEPLPGEAPPAVAPAPPAAPALAPGRGRVEGRPGALPPAPPPSDEGDPDLAGA